MSNLFKTLLAYKKTVAAVLAFVALVLSQFTQTFGNEVPPTVTAWIATVLGLIATVTAVLGDFSQPASVALKTPKQAA